MLFGCNAPAASSSPVRADLGSKAAGPQASAPRSAEKTLALAAVEGQSHVDLEITRLERSLRARPDDAAGWVSLGRAWVRKARESTDPGFYLDADACAKLALGQQPSFVPALDLRALVMLNDHRFEEARDLAQKIVDVHPEDPMGYGSLSDALLELGRFDEASAATQKMVDLKPNLASYSRASYIDWLRGDVDGALESARLAIDSGGDRADPEPRAWQLVQTATVFWQKGDYAGADAGFDLAMDKGMADYPPALVGKARSALARGDGKRAAELLDRAWTRSRLVQTAWLLGDARAMAGDAEGAAKAYALVEQDGARTDRRTLSLYYSTKNVQPEKALALAEEERKVRGGVYTEDAYAWALHRNGREAEARASIDRATALGTPDAMLLFHAGAIRIAQRDLAGGRKLVARALALNPKFDVTGAEEASRLLDAGVGAGGT